MRALDDITGAIVDAAIKIHRELGPGLLETVYEVVLARALERRGFRVERQKCIRFEYDGMMFEEGFRADLLVEEGVVVELKSVEKLSPVHSKQLLTYLRLMRLPVGLLLNFGHVTLKEGLHRIVNHLQPSASPQLRVNQPCTP
jgi:GxxExxY protein